MTKSHKFIVTFVGSTTEQLWGGPLAVVKVSEGASEAVHIGAGPVRLAVGYLYLHRGDHLCGFIQGEFTRNRNVMREWSNKIGNLSCMR